MPSRARTVDLARSRQAAALERELPKRATQPAFSGSQLEAVRGVVPATITGPRTPAQLESSERALAIELDTDTLADLDRIWPGPGEAPQAYAW
jgi:aryl-alcohol dehydrogenase-like predicted oxidoreductase